MGLFFWKKLVVLVTIFFWSNFFHKQTLSVPRKVLSSMGLFFWKKTLVFLVTIFFWSNFFHKQTLFVPRKVLSSMGLFFWKKTRLLSHYLLLKQLVSPANAFRSQEGLVFNGSLLLKKTLVFLVTIFFWSNFFLEQTLFVPRKVLSSMGLFFWKKLWSS